VFGAAFIDRLAVPIASPGANGLVSSARSSERTERAKNAYLYLCARKSATRLMPHAREEWPAISLGSAETRARTIAPENNK
jgi:hypothetical protein